MTRPTDLALELARRWIDAESNAEQLSDAYQRETQRLGRERDEAGKGLDMMRSEHVRITQALEAELSEMTNARDDIAANNERQTQAILEARRQRDEADVRAAALEQRDDAIDDRLRAMADLEAARAELASLRRELRASFDAEGLTAEQMRAGMAAEGRSYTVTSPYLPGPWRVMMTWCPGGPHAGSPVADHDHVRLTPMFGPDPEGWTLEAPIAPLKLDRYEF